MENLAREQNPNPNVIADVDRTVVRELTRCGIPAVPVEQGGVEVPYRHIGKLGDFTFRRAWYYWIVSGRVPLYVANELYADPICKTDVRAGGHCACPPPRSQVTYLDAEGRELFKSKGSDKDAEEEAMLDRLGTPDWREKYHIVENPEGVAAAAFVDTYHIDSELGLYLFVQALRRNGLVG